MYGSYRLYSLCLEINNHLEIDCVIEIKTSSKKKILFLDSIFGMCNIFQNLLFFSSDTL